MIENLVQFVYTLLLKSFEFFFFHNFFFGKGEVRHEAELGICPVK